MTLGDICSRIDHYLRSDDTRPRIVNFQDRESLSAFRNHFDVGHAVFKAPEDYSKPDENLRTEDLYDDLAHLQGRVFLFGFTSHLKLKGRDELQQFIAKIAHMSFPSGKLILVSFLCNDLLQFDDSRFQSLVYFADGISSTVPGIRFIAEGLSLPKGVKATNGIHKMGTLIESIDVETVFIRTKKQASDYPGSIYSIEEFVDSYSALCALDIATAQLSKELGTAEQWDFAVKEVSRAENWSNLITQSFGNPYMLELVAGQWDSLSNNMKWLYFIALKLFGARRNWCLNNAANAAASPKDLVRKIYRSILAEDCYSITFLSHYTERKLLLQQMFDTEDDAEVVDYIKMTKQHKKDAIRYLTSNTKLEKEAIIDLINLYASEYTRQELSDILSVVYPELSAYLSAYSFPDNEWLDTYFMEYRYSKVMNHISDALMAMAKEQAEKRDFFKLPPRITKVDSISKDGTFLYFVDAMGIEFIPYIAQKCRGYDLKFSVSIAHCELPSLTRRNKDFFESYPPKQRTKVSELDGIIHHGKENYNYQVTKTPLHLIRELEIIDEVLRNARTKLLSGTYDRMLLVADHGATRMAVINERIIDIDVNSKGTNSGRVCEFTDAVKTVPFATQEGDYYVLASYDRFKGGQPANVEAHGGATLEEVLVPVIELTMMTEDIEVRVDPTVIEYSFKQPPVLKLFSKTVLSKVRVLINGNWYNADESMDGQNFSFTLQGLKKGNYTVALYADGNEVATGLTFEARSKVGSSTNKGGIL